MPKTKVWFFQEDSGSVPVLDWLKRLRDRDHRAYAKCVARIRRLSDLGHELRRPEADYLKDGLYELRIRSGNVHYRLIYFHYGSNTSVLVHAVQKEDRIPATAMEIALWRKHQFEKNTETHSLTHDIHDLEG